jgi:glutathione synthase
MSWITFSYSLVPVLLGQVQFQQNTKFMIMNILFILDPLDQLKAEKDSSIAMMRAAQAQGYTIFVCESQNIFWQQKQAVGANVQGIYVHSDNSHWFDVTEEKKCAINSFSTVLMRTDPPTDSEYLYCTHLLEHAKRQGAKVFNDPTALRQHQEKLAIMEFDQFIAPTIVTRDRAAIIEFHEHYQDIILKPLDGMGGKGIFRIKNDSLNLASIIETLGENGSITLMAQQYLPAIIEGDKRILLIDGVAIPFCLARIPQGKDIRGNLAAGGIGVAQPLTNEDKAIVQVIGPTLAKRGLFLIGLDIIGNKLTEINVTSPTCFQEITQQTGIDVAEIFIKSLRSII